MTTSNPHSDGFTEHGRLLPAFAFALLGFCTCPLRQASCWLPTTATNAATNAATTASIHFFLSRSSH